MTTRPITQRRRRDPGAVPDVHRRWLRHDPDRARGRHRTGAARGVGPPLPARQPARASTARATSGCAWSAASRRCSIRWWRRSTTCPSTSIRRTPRATCSTCSPSGSGLEHDEARSGEERRAIVRMAPELMRRRGTRAGLELALSLAFPGVPFRVEDARRGDVVAGPRRGGEAGAAVVRRLLRRAALAGAVRRRWLGSSTRPNRRT